MPIMVSTNQKIAFQAPTNCPLARSSCVQYRSFFFYVLQAGIHTAIKLRTWPEPTPVSMTLTWHCFWKRSPNEQMTLIRLPTAKGIKTNSWRVANNQGADGHFFVPSLLWPLKNKRLVRCSFYLRKCTKMCTKLCHAMQHCPQKSRFLNDNSPLLWVF